MRRGGAARGALVTRVGLVGLVRLVCLGALAACGETARDLGPFSIRLALDPEAGCDPALACDDYGMSCGAALLYRIVDLEAGPTIDGVASGEEIESRCLDVPPQGDSICALGELDPFRAIPPHRIRIEVAAWRPELVTVTGPNGEATLDCPPADQVFTLDGQIRTDLSPQPAFGGAAVFDAGSAALEAVVPMACNDPAQLDIAECAATEQTLVTALVADVETSLDITASQASSVTVSVVEPEFRQDDGGGTVFTINAGEAVPLTLNQFPTPTFVAQVPSSQVASMMCTLVVELVPRSTAAVVCASGPAGGAMRDVRGAFVPRATLDDILDALAEPFPTRGLLVGRVVDHTGAPLAGVTVSPATGSVAYLSSDRSSLIGTATSASGYFVATDVPFDTAFTATHNVDGRREDGAPRGGLVENQLTVLVIRMQEP